MLKDIEVKKSGKTGFGAFAKKNFKKGSLVIDSVPGRIVHRKDAKYITPKSERWDYYDANHYYFMGDPEYHINHSCNPNVYIKNKNIYAMQDIKKGQEIFFDYSINALDFDNPIHGVNFSWKMKCNCGSKNCRKIVEGNFFKLPKGLQKKYLPYLDNWFKKKFKNKRLI
jgi:SET domain-containing protein